MAKEPMLMGGAAGEGLNLKEPGVNSLAVALRVNSLAFGFRERESGFMGDAAGYTGSGIVVRWGVRTRASLDGVEGAETLTSFGAEEGAVGAGPFF